MNAPSKDILTILEVSSTGLVGGTNLFSGKMPPSPHECVAIIDRPGASPDASGNLIRNPGIMVKIRGKKNAYISGQAVAETVFNQLHGYSNTTVGGSMYMQIRAVGDINFIGYDENNRPEWTINFSIKRT